MNIYKTTRWVIVHRDGPMEHNMYKTLQILLHNVSNKVIVYVQLYAYHVHFVANKPVRAQVTHASHMQCIQLHTACDTCNTAQRGRQTSHCKVIHISHLLITTARIYRWDRLLKIPARLSTCNMRRRRGWWWNKFQFLGYFAEIWILTRLTKMASINPLDTCKRKFSGGFNSTPWGLLPPTGLWLVKIPLTLIYQTYFLY